MLGETIVFMAKIVIVGTSHIASEALAKVKQAIEEEKPDLVAIELDPKRYYAMSQKAKPKFNLRYGSFAMMFGVLQQYLSKKTGILPGAEMMEAAELGKASGAKVILIDQDIEVTMRKIQKISARKKIKLMLTLLWALIFEKKEKLDLNKIPEDSLVEEALKILKNLSPELYKILIVERNVYMAQMIKELQKQYKTIVVVVGVGHKKGLYRLLR